MTRLQNQAEKGIANLSIFIARGISEALLIGLVLYDKAATRFEGRNRNTNHPAPLPKAGLSD